MNHQLQAHQGHHPLRSFHRSKTQRHSKGPNSARRSTDTQTCPPTTQPTYRLSGINFTSPDIDQQISRNLYLPQFSLRLYRRRKWQTDPQFFPFYSTPTGPVETNLTSSTPHPKDQCEKRTSGSRQIAPTIPNPPIYTQTAISAKDCKSRSLQKLLSQIQLLHPTTTIQACITDKWFPQQQQFREKQQNFHLVLYISLYHIPNPSLLPMFGLKFSTAETNSSPSVVSVQRSCVSDFLLENAPITKIEAYCILQNSTRLTPAHIFVQNLSIEGSDAFDHLQFLSEDMGFQFDNPLSAEFRSSNGRADGHRNSTEKKMSLIMPARELRIFAGDCMDLLREEDATSDVSLRCYPACVRVNCLMKTPRINDQQRVTLRGREILVQGTNIPQDQLARWKPIGYFTGLDRHTSLCLDYLAVAIKAHILLLLRVAGQSEMAILAETHVDFTFRPIQFKVGQATRHIQLGELYYCADPALIGGQDATAFAEGISPLVQNLLLSGDQTSPHGVVDIAGTQIRFSKPVFQLPVPAPPTIKILTAPSDPRVLYPVAFLGLRPFPSLALIILRLQQIGLPQGAVVRAMYSILDKPKEGTLLKHEWALRQHPVLWFHSPLDAHVVVNRYTNVIAVLQDMRENAIAPIHVRALVPIPPPGTALYPFTTPRHRVLISIDHLCQRWNALTIDRVDAILTSPEILPSRLPGPDCDTPLHRDRSCSPGKRGRLDRDSDPISEMDDSELENKILSYLRMRIARHPAAGLVFAQQLLDQVISEARDDGQFVGPEEPISQASQQSPLRTPKNRPRASRFSDSNQPPPGFSHGTTLRGETPMVEEGEVAEGL